MTPETPKIRRYRCAWAGTVEADGKWVRYKDYAALEAERDAMREAIREWVEAERGINISDVAYEHRRKALAALRAFLPQETEK